MKIHYLSILLISAFLFAGCFGRNTDSAPVDDVSVPTKAPTPTPPETVLAPDERPEITLTPDAELHNVTLTIDNLPEDVTTVDYELVYVSEGLPRGVIGSYSVVKGTANLLLGSCSSGVCKYDKDITEGQLTIKYRTDGERVLLREPLVLESE